MTLDKLIDQWRRCGGDKCQRRQCPRCRRGAVLTATRKEEGS